MSINLLSISKSEENERRIATIGEVFKLYKALQKLLKKTKISASKIKEDTLKTLHSDISKTVELNNIIHNNKQEDTTYPLRTNKNIEGFIGAEYVIKLHFDKIITGKIWTHFSIHKEEETILGYHNTLDIKGTSSLNFIQIAFFSIISVLFNNDKSEIFDFLESQSIYDINTSPNLQGTLLPNTIQSELTFDINKWCYFKKCQDNATGELLYFHTGYAFGGSAGDLKYKYKKFRSEDCFTSLIKWLDSEHLFDFRQLQDVSTLDVEKYFDACYLDGTSDFYNIFEQMFTPIGNTLDDVEKGDIFAYRAYDINNSPSKSNYKYSLNEKGHIGIVTDVDAKLGYYDTLSYSRNIMEKEGLGYYRESIYNPYKKYMFFRPINCLV